MAFPFPFATGHDPSQNMHYHDGQYEALQQSDERNHLKSPYYNPFEVKHRRRTTKSQFMVLEKSFEDNAKPSASTRKTLADQLDMTPRGVQVWFQNRRAKAKMQKSHPNEGSSQDFEPAGELCCNGPEHGYLHFSDYADEPLELSNRDIVDLSPGEQSSSLANSDTSASSRQYSASSQTSNAYWTPAGLGGNNFTDEPKAGVNAHNISYGQARSERRSSMSGPLNSKESHKLASLTAETQSYIGAHTSAFQAQNGQDTGNFGWSQSQPPYSGVPMNAIGCEDRQMMMNMALPWQVQHPQLKANPPQAWAPHGRVEDDQSLDSSNYVQPVTYPPDFDFARRASCPADFIASFYNMDVTKSETYEAPSVSMAPAPIDVNRKDSGLGFTAQRALRDQGASAMRRPSIANLNLATIREDEDHAFALAHLTSLAEPAAADLRISTPFSMRRRASTPVLTHTPEAMTMSLQGTDQSNHMIGHSGAVQQYTNGLNSQPLEEDHVDRLLREIMMPVSGINSASSPQVSTHLPTSIQANVNHVSTVSNQSVLGTSTAPASAFVHPHITSFRLGLNNSNGPLSGFQATRRASMPTLAARSPGTSDLTGECFYSTGPDRQHIYAEDAQNAHSASSPRFRPVSPLVSMAGSTEHALAGMHSPLVASRASRSGYSTPCWVPSTLGTTQPYTYNGLIATSSSLDGIAQGLSRQFEPQCSQVEDKSSSTIPAYSPQVSAAWTSEAIEFQL